MAAKKSKIAEDDPLGALLGAAAEDDSSEPAEIEDDGTLDAQALIDAINAGDAAGVRDAFTALNLKMKPPGEDDLEMRPEEASGASLKEMA